MNTGKARLILDIDPQAGWFNMAADEWLALNLPRTNYAGVLRFYRWQPPAVSLGVHQQPEVMDREALAARGLDLVRRPTGGRALLHLDDLSYSVCIRRSDDVRELKRVYQHVAEAIRGVILDLIGKIGDHPPLIPPASGGEIFKTTPASGGEFGNQPPASEWELQTPSRPKIVRDGLCMTTQVRGEVMIAGRKIAAAAQRIYRDSILQHGSIQLCGDPTAIAQTVSRSPLEREAIAEHLRRSTTTLQEVLGREPDVADLMSKLTERILDTLEMETVEKPWESDERDEIESLRAVFDLHTQPSLLATAAVA